MGFLRWVGASVAAYALFFLVRPFRPDMDAFATRPDDAKLLRSFQYFAFEASDGATLQVIEAGDRDADKGTILLLPGFPETAALAWARYIHHFADQGFHVLAPDQRGYNASSRPDDVASYRMAQLADDAASLVRARAVDAQAVWVGHDWGAAVAWAGALDHPETVRKLVILDVPHPQALKEAVVFLRLPMQLVRSLYMFFFQLPLVSEWRLERDDGQALMASDFVPGLSLAKPGTFSHEYLALARPAWALGMRHPLLWYRAALRESIFWPFEFKHGLNVQAETMILWGAHDYHLMEETIALSLAYVPDATVHVLPTSHWTQHEAFADVSRLVQAFAE